jgi:hypothetical protein
VNGSRKQRSACPAHFSVRREAIQQPIPKRSAQRRLRTAARRMGGIPGVTSPAAGPVVVSDHGSAVAVARPASTCRVPVHGERAIGVAPRENVVPRGRHVGTSLRQRSIRGQIDVLAVEFPDARCDLDTPSVDPRPPTDPVARVHNWRTGRCRCTEVRTPQSIPSPDRRGTLTTDVIGAGQAGEIAAEAASGARHAERHLRRDRWCVRRRRRDCGEYRDHGEKLNDPHVRNYRR